MITALVMIPLVVFAAVGVTVWIGLAVDLVQGQRTAHPALRWPVAIAPAVLVLLIVWGLLA